MSEYAPEHISTEQRIKSLMKEYAAKLSEFADSVQLFASWGDHGQTHSHYTGAGNWFARQGMAHDFITADEAQTHANELGDVLNNDDDEESWKI